MPVRRLDEEGPGAGGVVRVFGTTGPVEHLYVGDSFAARVSWTTIEGARPLSPPASSCRVRGPGGASQKVAVREAERGYEAEFLLDRPGQWWYAFDPGEGYSGHAEGVVVAAERRV